MARLIGERHASACRYENNVPEGSRHSARRTHFWPRENDFAVLRADTLQSSSGSQVKIGFCFRRPLVWVPHAVGFGSFNRVPSGPRGVWGSVRIHQDREPPWRSQNQVIRFRQSALSSISANKYRPPSSAGSAAAVLTAAVLAKEAQHVQKWSLFRRQVESIDVSSLPRNKLPEFFVILTTRPNRLKWNSATGQRDRSFMQNCRKTSIRAHIHFRHGSHL